MHHASLTVLHFGCAAAPRDWWLSRAVNIQRLYYIKSGSGFYRLADGSERPFEAGKLYIHPYNLHDSFGSDERDPIEHLYLDFLSTPPIIAPEPLVYAVEPGGSIHRLLTLMEEVFLDYRREFGRRTHIDQRIEAAGDRWGEKQQLILHLIHSLLILLSLKRPLPFSDDAPVCETLELIRTNYASPLNVRELAAKSGFEVNYFIRRFKSIMGVTPYAYLRTYRLLKAKELIVSGCTAAEAAEAVGYENASSLRRALRGG